MKGSNAKASTVGTEPETSNGEPKPKDRASIALDPAANGMAALRLFNKGSFGDVGESETYTTMLAHANAVKAGDLQRYRAMLAMQADTLNGIFTEMARRAAVNMGEYMNATQLYMRLGLKAQAQCRVTIEALDRLTTGHVQTVKHVHVNEGGQAVIADQFHNHTGGSKNGQIAEQPHATGTAAASAGAALPGPDPLRQAVPVPGSEGEPAMQDARRKR